LGEPTAFYTYSGLVRIDDRLIHGQVLVNWVRALALSRLVIVDDGLAGDALACSILEAIVPRHVSLWIGSAAGLKYATFPEPVDKQLVLVASPFGALRLYDAGMHYLALNVGCLGSTNNRVRLFPQVSLTRAEYDVLVTLSLRGVTVISQALPSGPVVRWPEIAARGSRLLLRQVGGR